MSTLGKAINVTSKVTAALSLGMDGFDILAMGYRYLIHPTHWLNLTKNCIPVHFTTDFRLLLMRWLRLPPGGINNEVLCCRHDDIDYDRFGCDREYQAGDKVIATNPETFEVAEKTVLETYVRETTELLHLTIGGEVIKTTFDHPFYVKMWVLLRLSNCM